MVVGNKKFGVVSYVIVEGYSPPENICIFLPLWDWDYDSYVHFLNQIFGYTALHYAVDRLNLQLN